MFSFLLNGYYDIYLGNLIGSNNKKESTSIIKNIVPYVTAGLGAGVNRTTDLNDVPNNIKWNGKNKTNFTWNVGAGIKLNLTKRFSLDFGYRYLDLGEAHTKDDATLTKPEVQKIRAHKIIGSIIYKF